MKDVSVRAFEAIVRSVERSGRGLDWLVEGTALSKQIFEQPNAWVVWDDFTRIMANLGRVYSDDELRALGAEFLEAKVNAPIRAVGRVLFDTRSLYHWVGTSGTGVGDSYFPGIKAVPVDAGPGILDIDFFLPEGRRMCREFFVITQGLFMALPRLVAGDPASVELDLHETSARYRVCFRPEGKARRWWRRAITSPLAAQLSAHGLRDVLRQSQERLEALAAAQGELDRQAEQLRLAHRIASVVHQDLDR